MSYTKEAVAETSSAIPSMPPMQLREEREVDPHKHLTRLNKASAAVASGQQGINSDAAEPAKSEETVTLSPQMAALARKEQRFRQQEQAVKDREKALEAKAAKYAELEALQAKLDAGDYSDLDSKVGYDKFTQWKIDQSTATTPEQQAIKALEEKLGSVERAQQEDVTKRFEAAVTDRRNAVKTLVESNVEYSSIKKMDMQEAVVQHILDTWEHDNTELTPEQAAKEVSDILKEKAKKWASILEEQAPAVEEKKQLPPLKQGLKTLTNQMTTAGDLKRPVKSFQGMSDQERYAEARRRAEERIKQQGK